MREMTDFKEMFLHIFDFLPQVFDIRLESLHLQGPSLLQSFITLSHQLQTFGYLVRALLNTHTQNSEASLTFRPPQLFNKT